VPVTVLRPSIIVGHSRTGEIDRLDGPYLLVLLLLTSPVEITLPLPTRGDAPLNLVPIDYVARAAAAMMVEPGAVSRTFHLVDPAPLPARRVFELVAATAGRKLPRGFIPVNLTRALLRTPGLERFVKSPRAFLERLATPVTYASNGAREILVPLGIECAPFEQYVDPLVTHVRERLAARRAQQTGESSGEVEDPLA
jgi:thioester reductase-like protein